jgi:hypothetical protein
VGLPLLPPAWGLAYLPVSLPLALHGILGLSSRPDALGMGCMSLSQEVCRPPFLHLSRGDNHLHLPSTDFVMGTGKSLLYVIL